MLFHLITIFLLFIPVMHRASAQGITMEETLTYINAKLAPHSDIDVVRGVLIAKYYDGQTIIREDQVFCKALDLKTMSYDSENRLFYINCSGTSKCVDRQLFERKIQRDYNRISFPANLNNDSQEGMKRAITHMIMLVLDPNYESSDPFE